MHHKLNYHEKLKPLARKLRTEGTKGEAILWFNALKARKMYGYQFKRQFHVNGYLADFICSDLKLIIKINGHSQPSVSERKMQDDLEQTGYVILKFEEEEIVDRLDDVSDEISFMIELLRKNIKLLPN